MAPDIIQDAMVKLLAGNVPVPDDRKKAWSSVLNAIRNVAWNHFRSEQVRNATPLASSNSVISRRDSAGFVGDVAWAVCRRLELRAELTWALEGLTVAEREVVEMRYLREYTTAEVAEFRECSPGTVRNVASRALAKLRTELDGRFGPA